MKHLNKIFLIIILGFYFLPNALFCQIYSDKVFNDLMNFNDRLFLDKDSSDFSGKTFKSNAYFIWAQFDDSANFSVATFNSNTSFRWSEFNSKADFIMATFKSKTDFYYAIFNGVADFNDAIFDTNAVFTWAQFYRIAIFSGARLYKKADFSGVVFDSTAVFWGAKFDYSANFSRATFNKDVYFENASLPLILDFSNIKNISKEIDLSLAKTTYDTCYIDLFGSDISKIKINYTKFRLFFNESDNLDWDQKSSVYNSLLEKFKNDGLTESYKNLDIEYRTKKAENGDWFDNKINFINYWWWEYGYSKWWIFRWIAIFIFLFTIITYTKIYYLLDNVYPVKFINKFREENHDNMEKYKKRYKIRCSFYFCFLLFFGLKLDYDEIKSTNRWLVYIISIYIVGLICTAYLFNFVISK